MSNVRVTIEFVGMLRHAVGCASAIVELTGDVTVARVIDQLIDTHGDAVRPVLIEGDAVHPALLVAVDDRQTRSIDLPLHDGARVTLMPPISGG